MGLFDSIKNAVARRAEAPIIARVDTVEHAEALVLSTIAGGGSATGAWVKGLAVAFGAGALGAGAMLLDDPGQILAPGGLQHFAVKAVAMGLVAAGLYLKGSPLPPKIDPGSVVPDGRGGVRIVPPPARPAVAAVQAEQAEMAAVQDAAQPVPAMAAEEEWMRRTGKTLDEIRGLPRLPPRGPAGLS